MTTRKQDATPIKLDVSKVSTLHVNSGDQKIATLCVVVKDSPAIETLLEHSLPLNKMVITDVIPRKGNPETADIIFRHLTNEEIAQMSRNFFLPLDSIHEIFGEFLKEVQEESHSEIHAEVIELNSDDVDEVLQQYNDEQNTTPLKELFKKIEAKIPETPQVEEDTNTYMLTVSLAEAHLAQTLCVNTNAPAFALTSESLIDTHKQNPNNTWEDFLAILEFPYTDTPEYFDSTASLVQAVTGAFPLNLNVDAINSLRAQLMNDVLKLANGSEKTLINTFGLINPLNKISRNREKELKPEREDASYLFRQDMINKLYDMSSPQVIASILKDTPNTSQYIDDIQTVDSLFQESGLTEMFQDILEEEFHSKELTLAPNASQEDVIGYYSTPITPDTFPAEMKNLVSKIHMPLLFEHNWAGGNVDLEPTKTNVGEISVARLITLAVRFARLKKIVETIPTKLVPVGLLIQGVAFHGESTYWAFLEAIKLLAKNGEDRILFDMLTVVGLPEADSVEEIVPEEILPSAAAAIMHRVGHAVLAEGWEQVVINGSLAGKPLATEFIDSIYNTTFEANDDGDEANHHRSKPCPVMLTTFQFFTRRPDPQQLVTELGDLVKALAELNALKHTDFHSGSQEWNDYVEGYVVNLFSERS